ncbi:MAG TPA: hypothetical protein VK447_18225 [Myxococcaceae bacterium]|nr:hypothetical protein [Myxococcaceae bacterium]
MSTKPAVTAVTGGVPADKHAALYGRLRASILSRQFAFGRYFRANLISPGNELEARVRANELRAKEPSAQEEERWRVHHHIRENPLLFEGQLLTCLAIEYALGAKESLRPIRAAIDALGSLYKYRGNHFDGYILRWDPVTSDHWTFTEENGRRVPAHCHEFLIGEDGRYQYVTPSHDPRALPMRTAAQLSTLSPQARQEYLNRHWEFVDLHRRRESSMDELVGLMLGYFMVHHLVPEPALQQEVRRQVNALGDYLAEHAYLLVRPVGGFNARGGGGLMPALEFPFGQAFKRMTGNAYASRTNLEGALRKAGLWPAFEGPFKKWSTVGVALEVLLAPLAGTFAAAFSLLAGKWVSPAQLGRAYAMYEQRHLLDVWNETYAGEYLISAIVGGIEPRRRLELWFTATASLGKSPATVFPPFLALLSLDGPDPFVRQRYLAWLSERLQHPKLDPNEHWGAPSCFAAGVAAVLGGGQRWEKRLAERLEKSHAFLQGDCCGDVELQDQFEGRDWQSTHESALSALDYMTGVALSWLHQRRHEEAGSPVTAAPLPSYAPPAVSLEPVIPRAICAAAREGRVPLPLEVLPTHADAAARGVPLFADPVPPKSAEPPPRLPPRPTRLIHDHPVVIREANRDVDTGVVLRNGDEFELETTGTITPGVIGAGPTGPGGWKDRIAYGPHFPLHGGIDPVHAHPYCLLGKLNGYFFVGERRPRQRYLDREERRLFLRINDDVPGNGGGAFICRVKVWGAPRG